jgi:hypothetical protein
MKEKVRLRPHHLICHRLFSGQGYDQAFVDNMRVVISKLESNPSMRIDVSAECDDICASCPHGKGGVCDFGESVMNKDASAAKFLHVPAPSHLSARQLDALLEFRFKKLDSIASVCGECEWSEACDRQLRALKSGR